MSRNARVNRMGRKVKYSRTKAMLEKLHGHNKILAHEHTKQQGEIDSLKKMLKE